MGEEEIKAWREVINSFLAKKLEADFVKYLKEVFKETENKYLQEDLKENEDIEFIFNTKKNKKKEDQLESDFILEQLNKLASLPNKPSHLDFDLLNSDIGVKKEELLMKYLPANWISWAAANAKNITFATHVAKLTHSSIDSSSFLDIKANKKDSYLTTSTLKGGAIDGAVRGNQYAPIYQFLELELNNKKLASEFKNIENNLLDPFSATKEQLQSWNQGFASALCEGTPSAHALLKQVYYPITETSYHLLCNVVSSSMAQALFEFRRQNSDATYKLREKKKYSEETYLNFPNRASISITASNHGNASQLNGKRGGRLDLFSCHPPVWQSQLKPPIYRSSFFYELTKSYEVREIIQFLAEFLSRYENLQLSIKDPKRMQWIEQWINDLTDEVILYIATIQALPSGWSETENIKLKKEHQILLDWYNNDDEFQNLRANSNWQQVIVKDFASWLNFRLRKIKEKFTPQDIHTKLWMKFFEKGFRETLEAKQASKQEALV